MHGSAAACSATTARWSTRSSTRSPTASRPPGASAESSPTRSTLETQVRELKGARTSSPIRSSPPSRPRARLRSRHGARPRSSSPRPLRSPLDRPHRRGRAPAAVHRGAASRGDAAHRARDRPDEHAAPQAALAPAPVAPVEPAAPAETVHPASQATRVVEPAPAAVAAAEPVSPGGWPIEEVPEARRQDTREFTPITLPPVELDELQVDVPEPRIGQFVGGESRNFDWGD